MLKVCEDEQLVWSKNRRVFCTDTTAQRRLLALPYMTVQSSVCC